MNARDGRGLNFGRKLGVFKVKTATFIAALGTGLLLAAVGLALFIQALISRPGPDLVTLFLSLLIIYLAATLLFFAYNRYQQMKTRYSLYEFGLQHHDGKRINSITWDEVQRVHREREKKGGSAAAGRKNEYKRLKALQLIGQGGHKVTIKDQPRLANIVLGMLLVHHWPLVQQQIESGHKVYLSRLHVLKEGLHYKERLLPWSKIHRAHTAGHIRLETVSGPIDMPQINDRDTNDVLGYLLLQRALEYYVGRDPQEI